MCWDGNFLRRGPPAALSPAALATPNAFAEAHADAAALQAPSPSPSVLSQCRPTPLDPNPGPCPRSTVLVTNTPGAAPAGSPNPTSAEQFPLPFCRLSPVRCQCGSVPGKETEREQAWLDPEGTLPHGRLPQRLFFFAGFQQPQQCSWRVGGFKGAKVGQTERGPVWKGMLDGESLGDGDRSAQDPKTVNPALIYTSGSACHFHISCRYKWVKMLDWGWGGEAMRIHPLPRFVVHPQ